MTFVSLALMTVATLLAVCLTAAALWVWMVVNEVKDDPDED